MGKVSVVMNCRNSGRYLREAIESVFAQTFEDWEIVFFDNLSTDDSPEIAKSYAPKLKYYRVDTPLALGEARNQALKKCQGEYIAFLDCDDIWLPNKLERQMDVFEKHPEISFVHSNYLSFDTRGVVNLVESSKTFMGDAFKKYLARYSIGIPTVVMKSSILQRMDEWFDPNLNLVEDYDFFMRALYLAHIYYDGEPLVKYRIHDSNLSRLLKDQWATEFEKVYQKFIKLVPNFETQYREEAKSIRANIAYLHARSFIFANDPRAARRVLAKEKFSSWKCFSTYVLTYFPPKLWQSLYEAYVQSKSRIKGVLTRQITKG